MLNHTDVSLSKTFEPLCIPIMNSIVNSIILFSSIYFLHQINNLTIDIRHTRNNILSFNQFNETFVKIINNILIKFNSSRP